MLDNSSAIFVDLNDDLTELFLLSKFTKFVPSPSTFVWWGIYLQPKPCTLYMAWGKGSEYRTNFYNEYDNMPHSTLLRINNQTFVIYNHMFYVTVRTKLRA